MSVITYHEVRKNFKSIMKRVSEDKETLTIAGENGNAVLLAESEYNSLLETLYLLQSPENAERLLKSIKQLEYNE
ncbi:type II toxin-antitoxin system Phd/YefM family antitoxin [Sinobaca sp. H24]|uniref:type II toxin-antitoxin system Phd/YefM family antitoxin n=1 Tax=Sinobaca sp. H24 TaxID=2923376 RepID=UPI0020791FB7|nr:type II toxin-antitoxin system prevent-host-death family antitoxin [Sinobaca sp. H24]